MMPPVLLENLAYPEIELLSQQNGGLLLLPLGATEQHGPHLPISMDTLLAESACHAVSEKTGVPVLPALRYTSSEGHTSKWPGTFSLSHETFIATLHEITNWAVASQWKRILFINSHFGNDAPARVAVDQLRRKYTDQLQIGLINVFHLSPEIWKEYSKDAEDLHANQAETALMLHLYPNLVHTDRLTTSDDPDRTNDTVFSYPVSQTSVNGVTGTPSLATADEGEKLFSQITTALVEKITAATIETPPLNP